MIAKWRKERRNRDRRNEELTFLPAALEVQETPPSPIGRTIIWMIVLLFIIALVWSILGKIDVVAVARGSIIPGDRTKVIQPLEIGTISAIHVRDGQSVTAGDTLLTLDTTQTDSDRIRLGNDLLDARLREQRQAHLLSLLEGEIETTEPDLIPPVEIDDSLLPEHLTTEAVQTRLLFQQQMLLQHYQSYLAEREELASEYDRQLAARATAESELLKTQRALPLLEERLTAYEDLLERDFVSRVDYLALKQSHVELGQDQMTLQSRVKELTLSLETTESAMASLLQDTRRSALEAQEQTRIQISQLEQEARKAEQRNRRQILHSPIAGTVQELAIHTIGGIVTPAQQIMTVVPDDGDVEVEAWISNRDIGFVEEGQSVEVKIDAFNFTQYGVIHGELIDISNDAIENEQGELIFLGRVRLDNNDIQVGNRLVRLSPGMTVAVEIKTGKRRLIEYFLSPLTRFKQESIRER